jgi:hypothetical protein
MMREFKDKFETGISDAERFITMNEIESLWSKLEGDTRNIYSDLVQNLLSSVNERDLIRKKKESTGSMG